MKLELSASLREIENLLMELVKVDKEVPESSPIYILSGQGHGWYYSPNVNQMLRLVRGEEIYPLQPKADEHGKVPCMYNTSIFMIPEDDIEEIGWN